MATLDSLQAEINSLDSRVSSLESTVSSHSTKIQNLEVIQSQHAKTLSEHEERLDDHDNQLEDHDKRLHILEDSNIDITFVRKGKMPTVDSEGLIKVYMPDNLTLEDFEEINEQVNIQNDFNWFRKISNIVGAGKVCFDFDRDKGIKSIILGQNTRLVIPTGLKIANITPEKSTLKVVNDFDIITHDGLCFGIEIINTKGGEIFVSLINNTNHTVHVYRGQVIASLIHVFQYKTVPVISKA